MRGTVIIVALSSGCASSSDDPDSDTQEPRECDLEALVSAALQPGPDVDCGLVTRQSSLAAWEAAQSCTMDALANGDRVLVYWQPSVIDGVATNAIAGAFAAEVRWYNHDAYDGETSISTYACGSIGLQDNCEVAVGQMCFDCVDYGPSTHPCE